MDETGLVITSITVTAGAVGAFWLRTESVREDIKNWVDEKYMTREATNLKFEAIKSILADQSADIAGVRKDIDTMEQGQRVQISLLRGISDRVGAKRPQEDKEYGSNTP